MVDHYEDIKHLSRPQYPDLPPMSRHDRAAQFSPFAALVGYDDEVAETARLVDSRVELTEDEICALNENLNRLLDALPAQPVIRVTYFVPDERKAGGSYVQKTGIVRIFDSFENTLVFQDGERIAVPELYAVQFIEESGADA
ncbi:MAG: hypothetical protein K5695_11555 [Oscillospiraceae bacterium]|nr:hypothetical protein [Oscillospiraceae bacterium]